MVTLIMLTRVAHVYTINSATMLSAPTQRPRAVRAEAPATKKKFTHNPKLGASNMPCTLLDVPEDVRRVLKVLALTRVNAMLATAPTESRPRVPATAGTKTETKKKAFTYDPKLGDSNMPCTFTEIPTVVRRVLNEKIALGHLSRSDFDSKNCRPFVGLSVDAATEVMRRIGPPSEQVLGDKGSMKRILFSVLTNVITNLCVRLA
ncbi:MAG: hypothetical protein WDW38_003952 [Sanguina aurantia]